MASQEVAATQQQFLDSINLKGYRVIGSQPHIEQRDEPVVIAGVATDKTKKVDYETGDIDWAVTGPSGEQGIITVKPTGEAEPGVITGYTVTTPLKLSTAGTQTKPSSSPLDKWVKLDKDGNVIPAGSATPAVTMVDPNDPTNKIVLDASKPEGTITPVGDNFYVVKADGSATLVTDKDGKPVTKSGGTQQFTVPGVGVVEYDPATKQTTTIVPEPQKPTVANAANIVWTNIEGSDQQQGNQVVDGKLTPIEGYTRKAPPEDADATSLYNDPNSPFLVWYDRKGNEVHRENKPGYQPPRTALTPDTVSPQIPFFNPSTGQIEYQANANQVKASQATADLAKQLGVTVAAGSMSEKQAQDIIASAISTMNAHTQAAQSSLSAIQQGAQTGAGLLQNRVSQATSTLQGLSGQFAQSKAMTAPAGLGGELVSGLQNWTTQLGGGQGVYDAAANMIQRADPTNRLGADAATAHAALSQMLSQYQQMTGQMHPLAQQTTQATQSFTAPPAQQTPQVGASPLTVTRPGAFATAPNLSAGGLGPVAGFTAPQSQPTVVLNIH